MFQSVISRSKNTRQLGLHPQKEEKRPSGGIVSGFMEIILGDRSSGVADSNSSLTSQSISSASSGMPKTKEDIHRRPFLVTFLDHDSAHQEVTIDHPFRRSCAMFSPKPSDPIPQVILEHSRMVKPSEILVMHYPVPLRLQDFSYSSLRHHRDIFISSEYEVERDWIVECAQDIKVRPVSCGGGMVAG